MVVCARSLERLESRDERLGVACKGAGVHLVRDAQGRPVPDPDPYPTNMGGLSWGREIKPGDRHYESLPLMRYRRFEKPGVYRLRVSHDFGWKATDPSKFPAAEATLTVNVLGSFAIGLLYMYVAARGTSADNARLFWMTGVLGGFTTYSSFNFETLRLFGAGRTGLAILYAMATFAGCLLAGLAGHAAGKTVAGA